MCVCMYVSLCVRVCVYLYRMLFVWGQEAYGMAVNGQCVCMYVCLSLSLCVYVHIYTYTWSEWGNFFMCANIGILV
jgi:hypothetical protein